MFTINNPVAKTLPDRFTNNSVFSIFQLEKGESGTPHLQGYLVLKPNPKNKNGYTLKWLKDNVCPFTHWEPRRGTHEQAVAYCSKEDTRVEGPWTVGAWEDTAGPSKAAAKGGKVNASKILQIKRKIDDGVDEEQLYEQHFGEMLRYAKAFDRYKMVKKNTFRNWHTKAFAFYGPPGTGKSFAVAQTAEANFGKDVFYLDLSGDTVWWDGYTGQKCVVIEEFYGQMKIGYLLKLLDRYPMQVQTKGSYVPFLAEVIFFTSNEHPRMWYGKGAAPGEPSKIPLDVLAALERRFQGKCGHIKEFKDKIVINDDIEVDAEDLLNTMIGATELYNAELDKAADLTAAKDADDDVDDKVIDLTSDEVLDPTPEDAWQDYDPDAYDDHHDVDEARALELAAQDCERQYFSTDASQKYGEIGNDFPLPGQDDDDIDIRRASKLRRTDTTRFTVIPPPKASAADFRRLKQIPGQSKLAVTKVNDDED